MICVLLTAAEAWLKSAATPKNQDPGRPNTVGWYVAGLWPSIQRLKADRVAGEPSGRGYWPWPYRE